MAKGTSSRGSAHGTPSSLTSLLSPVTQPQPLVDPMAELARVQQMWAANEEFFNRPPKLRGYVPEWDDKRRFSPEKPRRDPGAWIKSAARLHVSHRGVSIGSGLRFRVPNLITTCIRRKVRKEVMHALGRTKKGAKSGGRRRNQWSNIKC